MDRLVSLKQKEFNFQIALSILFLALLSLTGFLYGLLTEASLLFDAVTLSSFGAFAGLLVVNKQLLHHILRPVAVVLLNTFWSIEVDGVENISDKGGVLIAANHTGLLDSLIISVACKRPVCFLMTNEVFSWPYVGKIAGFFNVIPVMQGKGNEALNEGIQRLSEGKVLCIFPEGRCTENGSLNRFHRGVARIQTKSKAPLVPVAIQGGMEAWPIGGKPQRAHITVQISHALNCYDLKEKEITDNLKDAIQIMVDRIQQRQQVVEQKAYQDKVLSLMEAKSTLNATSQALSIKENNQWNDLTYNELSTRAKNFAGNLIQAGFKRGNKLAILSESRPEWGIAFFGAIRAGATVVPLDVKLTEEELFNIFSDCEPSVLCVSHKYAQQAKKLKARIDSIKQIYVIQNHLSDNELVSINDLNTVEEVVYKRRDLKETAIIVYTSGTTGCPKGVMVSFGNIISQLQDLEKEFCIQADDRFLSILPINHLLELTCGFLGVLNSGASVVYNSKLTPKAIVKTMQERKITYMIAVPLFLKMLKRSIEKEIQASGNFQQTIFNKAYVIAQYIPSVFVKKVIFRNIHRQFGSHLKGFISGGAPLDSEVAEFFDRIGIPVYQGYGLTETSPIISINSHKNNRYSSVGKILPSLEVKLSEAGEVQVKGPNVMQGYYNRADLTTEVIDQDGWFHTGDIGEFDKDGYLYITGRIKNMIVLGGGKKIFPEEVENVLSRSELIKEVCVIGTTVESGSKEGTEQVCAVIVPGEELMVRFKAQKPQLEKLISNEVDRLSADLAPYKRPTKVIISNRDLPKTATNKIKRKEVSGMLNTQSTLILAA